MKKEQFVEKMFSSIAPRYDKANSILTFGLDSLWRKKLVRLSCISKDSRILDCATGTGKLAFCFSRNLSEKGRVDAIDFCSNMLEQIQTKDSKVHFQKADIMNLPFSSNTFHVTSIAYGLRNLSDIEKGVMEMARVTRPGGFLMILETGSSFHPIMAPFLNFYFKKIVPCLGGWITGNPQAYKYLYESSFNFPSREELIDILKKTRCFKHISFFSLLGGASFIYKAEVL